MNRQLRIISLVICGLWPMTIVYAAESCLPSNPPIDWKSYEWTLIRGSGQPVCEEMLSYLKSRPKDIAPPTCPDERLPPNGNWTRPETRILTAAEKQALLRDIPEKYRQKPKGPVSYEQEIRDSKILRTIRGDITGDGIPETFLAIGGYKDINAVCERVKRCARPGEITNHWFELTSDSYELLPMNDAGTNVNWSHKSIYPNQLMSGVLIFYKRIPYWMSIVSWSQYYQDNFTKRYPRPDDPLTAIFVLYRISAYSAEDPKNRTPNFKDVTALSVDWNSNSNRVCRFGFFRRENLDQYRVSQ
jgi:hypothetical protein